MNSEIPRSQTPVPHTAGARDFLAVVFRRKGIIAGLFLIVTVTVFVITLTRPVEYVSFGRVLVKRGEQESVMNPGRRIAGWEEELATEAQVVKSWSVREVALKDLLAAAPRGTTDVGLDPSGLDVQVLGQSNVMEISYSAGDAGHAHAGCDAIINAYVQYRSSSESLPYPKTFFEGELHRVSVAMDSLTRVRRQFTENQDVVDVPEQRRSTLATIGGIMHERSIATGDLAEAAGNLRVLQTLHDHPDMDVPLFSQGFLNEAALADLKRTMIQQETKIAQLQERYRDDAPELQEARASLESMRGLLKREVDQALQLAQAKAQGLRARVENDDRQIADLQAQLSEIPAKESRLNDLDQRLTVLRERYLDLTRDSDQAKVTEQTSRRVSVVVLSPASMARARNTRDWVRLALAPAFSLVVGIGLAFFIDGLDTRLRTARDLEDTLSMPVLASLNERKG
jgi:succinoglycan biosynthesis transport protein ExoP